MAMINENSNKASQIDQESILNQLMMFVMGQGGMDYFQNRPPWEERVVDESSRLSDLMKEVNVETQLDSLKKSSPYGNRGKPWGPGDMISGSWIPEEDEWKGMTDSEGKLLTPESLEEKMQNMQLIVDERNRYDTDYQNTLISHLIEYIKEPKGFQDRILKDIGQYRRGGSEVLHKIAK